MLKLPKGLKKKKKGKKSKRKDEELFTEEELKKYKREHLAQQELKEEASSKENEEWSKFKDLTTGIDSVLKKTQGDLDRIKSTSFFQRVPVGPKEVDSVGQERKRVPRPPPPKPLLQLTEADFPQLVKSSTTVDSEGDVSECITEDESEDDQDDIFDTSYVEAVQRGEVKLAYVPESPDEIVDDDIFDTSHVDSLIKGKEVKNKESKGKKALDIGVAVEVLTGRIDNVTLRTPKKTKRVIPGELLLDTDSKESYSVEHITTEDSYITSILDTDEGIPISTPIDLSRSLYTPVLTEQTFTVIEEDQKPIDDEIDEFTLLATESLESNTLNNQSEEKLVIEPVIDKSWSVFEADTKESVFAQSILEDQLDSSLYVDENDPFDTSFAVSVIHKSAVTQNNLDDDDDFDPRADERKLNLRRKSSVRIHLTDPSGLRESITSDDIIEKENNILQNSDLLAGSYSDLTQIDSPIAPIEIKEIETDPFDTTIVDKLKGPGKAELKLLEKEFIENSAKNEIYRVPSDPDFNPRADECIKNSTRRSSRPENLIVNKSVAFCMDNSSEISIEVKPKHSKPLTPYYNRNISVSEDINKEIESEDIFNFEKSEKTKSIEDLREPSFFKEKRRFSEIPVSKKVCFSKSLKTNQLLDEDTSQIQTKVLTPSTEIIESQESFDIIDPFDTSFVPSIVPGKAELKLLAKEFSCEENNSEDKEEDLLAPSDDSIFQVKALSPEPSVLNKAQEYIDPFDTSFATAQPGRSELKLLESEFLN